jgi:CheY-like chemotaxis protein
MNDTLRIQLLDDDVFMLRMLTDMIDDLGYSHVHADTDARSALKTLAAFRPDVLICDLSLPEMDGIEFLRAVAEQGYAGGVILLSGMDSGILRAAEMLAMAQGLTIVGACRKPLSAAALADLLEVAGGGPAPLHGDRK